MPPRRSSQFGSGPSPYTGVRSSYGTQNPPYQSSPPQVKCRIWYDVDVKAYRISCPYNPSFVELIKLGIPVSDRAYDPSTKIWMFTDKYFDVIRDIAMRIWPIAGEVHIVGKQEAEDVAAKQKAQQANTGVNTPVAKATLSVVMSQFVDLLPIEALTAAYRRAAMELHPDKPQGSQDKMSLLNTLWDRIKEEKQIK